jgi:hypothetical protein
MAKAIQLAKVETIPPRGLSVRDAARYVGIAEKTLRNRLSDKDNPFPVCPRRYGGKPLFLKEELDDFLDNLPTG